MYTVVDRNGQVVEKELDAEELVRDLSLRRLFFAHDPRAPKKSPAWVGKAKGAKRSRSRTASK